MGKRKLFHKACLLDEEKVNSDKACDFRMVASELRDCRNMPFAFYGNASGGGHCGFFFTIDNYNFQHIDEYLNGNTGKFKDETLSILKEFFALVKQTDPNNKYILYWFK